MSDEQRQALKASGDAVRASLERAEKARQQMLENMSLSIIPVLKAERLAEWGRAVGIYGGNSYPVHKV